jgi:hypothetical protein
MNMLDQVIPGLTNTLRTLPLEQWRHVVAKASESLSRSIDGLEPAVRAWLASAVAQNALSAEQVAEARAYAEAADDRYFTLQEQGADQLEWRNWFAKARLATALADAFGGTQWDNAADALYELCFVDEDKSAAIALIESAFRGIKERN